MRRDGGASAAQPITCKLISQNECGNYSYKKAQTIPHTSLPHTICLSRHNVCCHVEKQRQWTADTATTRWLKYCYFCQFGLSAKSVITDCNHIRQIQPPLHWHAHSLATVVDTTDYTVTKLSVAQLASYKVMLAWL